jgi:hypothetical protein
MPSNCPVCHSRHRARPERCIACARNMHEYAALSGWHRSWYYRRWSYMLDYLRECGWAA